MIFFFYGEDSFRAYQKIQAITQKFQEKIDPGGHNIERLDGEILTPDIFFKAVSTIGFLADKKLVIVKNLLTNPKLKNWQDELIKFLNKQTDSPQENYIIFWESAKPDARLKLYKTLTKFKFVEEFQKLGNHQLETWIKKQANQYHKLIRPAAVNLLIAYVGNDLWQLHQEIQKLCHLTSGDITEEEVKEVVKAKIDDNIFNLVEALGKKDKARALKLIEDQLDAGSAPQYLLTMIVRQYRLIIKAKTLSSQVAYAGALAAALKIPNFVAQNILSQSKLYTLDQLKKIYSELMFLDEKFKTTQDQEKILFAQMINSL